jgi:von Willebrand factor A domain-containing protein 7
MSRKIRFAIVLVLATVSPLFAFKPAIHQQITVQQLTPITKTVNGHTYQFSIQAIEEVADADRAADCGSSPSALSVLCLCLSCQADPTVHFDNEAFTGGSSRLVALRNQIISEINASSPDGAAARRDLGAALHTVQDFYAHSNRVEENLTSFDAKLGAETFDGLGPSDMTCESDSTTLTGAGLTSITSGEFPKCNASDGKCVHGIIFTSLVCASGINKDDSSRPHFSDAFSAASTETTAFVNSILNDPAVTNNEKAIRALMGIRSTLGFIIDTTASMGDIIAQVQAQVVSTVNSVVGTDSEPDQYLLEPFNDPTWGPPFTTSDANAFISAVNALTADGGGDCPELAMHGALDAVSASYPDSKLFLYTDASAKDADLATAVIGTAQANNIQIDFFNYGSCSPIDPSYAQVANATGGQAFFLQRTEAGSTFSLIQPQLGVSPVTITNANGVMGSAAQTFSVPVDSTLGSITVSISVDVPGKMTITRANGTVVNPTDAGVTFTTLSSGEVVTISSPGTGPYTVQFAGSGNFALLVQGSTTSDQVNNIIGLSRATIVKLAGRLGHQGYYPTPGQPIAGGTLSALAAMRGSFATAAFKLITQAGSDLQAISLTAGDSNAGPNEFTGSLTIPSQPFRIAATGTDSKGNSFQRVYPTLFNPQSIEVTANNTTDQVPLGATTTLAYRATNYGAAGTFNLNSVDNRGFVGAVSPSTLSLASGASATVTLQVVVPTSASAGTMVQLTTTITNSVDSTLSNSTVQSLQVITGSGTPGLKIDVPNLDFGTGNVGSKNVSQTATLTSSGSANLNISSIVIGGDNSTDFTQANNCGAVPAALNEASECTLTVAFNPGGTGARSAYITVTDNAPDSPQTIFLTGSGVQPDFSLASTTTSITVNSGQSAAFGITLTPQGGFSSSVMLACSSITPSVSAGPSCVFSPASLSPGGTNPVQATLSVSTIAQTAAASARGRHLSRTEDVFASLLFLPLASFFFPAAWGTRRRRLLIIVVVCLLAAFVGCGGGSAPMTTPPPTPTGTPAGTYTIVVTASAGSLSHTTNLTLVVK